MTNISKLIGLAISNLDKSYSPYSNFKVSAIIETLDSKVYSGVNIENSSYSLTICAERVALFKAVSCGERYFKRLILIGGKGGLVTDYLYPCGACRQALSEFVNQKDFEVVIARSESDYRIYKFCELYPNSFGKEDLK